MSEQGTSSEEDIEEIGRYIMIEKTELGRADLGFLFGSRLSAEFLPKEAAQFYHEGYFPKIIVTGGVALESGVLESHRMQELLIEEGVRVEDILVEDRSANTQENIENAKDIIANDMGLENIGSVIAFGHICAGRRYIMTLKRRWPEVFAMACNVNPFPEAEKHDEWHKHEELRTRVLREWNKVVPYKEVGFIREVDIDAINAQARTLPQPGPSV